MFIPRWATVARIAVPAVWLSVFGYGLLRFPDAPISRCAHMFCGKTGQLHTLADYQAFRIWEPLMIITFVVSALIWLALYPKSYIGRD
jgi:hypothetical protein